jgi:hypothetical protein
MAAQRRLEAVRFNRRSLVRRKASTPANISWPASPGDVISSPSPHINFPQENDEKPQQVLPQMDISMEETIARIAARYADR